MNGRVLRLLLQLLPRLTSWSADERLASLRALAALMPISGFRLLNELPHLLLQLYETCVIEGGGPPGSRQDDQQQWSPLLFLVQHGILREINSRRNPGSDCSSSDSREPWHRGGLQEMGACSSLCNTLEAVELALHCTGEVALLLPPCSWLPLIASHLGLQRDAHQYIRDKEKVLANAVDDETEQKISMWSDLASHEEKVFLGRFPGGYQFVVNALGLNSPRCVRDQRRADYKANAGKAISATTHMCSSESRKQALLLLSRLLRGLKPYNEHGRKRQGQKPHENKGDAKIYHSGAYVLGRIELWLLVRIIEQVQGTECGRDNDEIMPFTAVLLLQLLHAAGELCQLEAKSLFAAALLQQIDPRSHKDITREAVGHIDTFSMNTLLWAHQQLSFFKRFCSGDVCDKLHRIHPGDCCILVVGMHAGPVVAGTVSVTGDKCLRVHW